MTNAAAQSIVSVDPANAALRAALESLLCSDPSLGGLALAAHTDAELASAEVQARSAGRSSRRRSPPRTASRSRSSS